jgi:hypothetical protein
MPARRIAFLPLKAVSLSGFLFAAAFTAVTLAGPARAEPSTASITAVYKLRFAGLSLGKFTIRLQLDDGEYALRGQGKLKLLTGIIFKLEGGTASSGEVSADGPRPKDFSFSFETKKKQGRLAMKFEDGAVSRVDSQPPLKKRDKAVPVTDEHVTGVVDPLTALFFSAEAAQAGKHASACDQRIPVYDGVYRFDLQLSHKKTVRVVRKGRSGYAGPAVICRVKYIPVAGHKPHASNVAFMSETDAIEVWLIPLPEDRMYAPYHLSIPTPYGTAEATSTVFRMETANRKKYALVK